MEEEKTKEYPEMNMDLGVLDIISKNYGRLEPYMKHLKDTYAFAFNSVNHCSMGSLINSLTQVINAEEMAKKSVAIEWQVHNSSGEPSDDDNYRATMKALSVLHDHFLWDLGQGYTNQCECHPRVNLDDKNNFTGIA